MVRFSPLLVTFVWALDYNQPVHSSFKVFWESKNLYELFLFPLPILLARLRSRIYCIIKLQMLCVVHEAYTEVLMPILTAMICEVKSILTPKDGLLASLGPMYLSFFYCDFFLPLVSFVFIVYPSVGDNLFPNSLQWTFSFIHVAAAKKPNLIKMMEQTLRNNRKMIKRLACLSMHFALNTLLMSYVDIWTILGLREAEQW